MLIRFLEKKFTRSYRQLSKTYISFVESVEAKWKANFSLRIGQISRAIKGWLSRTPVPNWVRTLGGETRYCHRSGGDNGVKYEGEGGRSIITVILSVLAVNTCLQHVMNSTFELRTLLLHGQKIIMSYCRSLLLSVISIIGLVYVWNSV